MIPGANGEAQRVDPLSSKTSVQCEKSDGQLKNKSTCLPHVGDASGHGDHYWHHITSMLHVKISGKQSLEVRTEPTVALSATLSLDIEDFYGQEDRYVLSVARSLGIDPSRIRVATAVPGSVVLQMTIGPNQEEMDEVMGTIPEDKEARPLSQRETSAKQRQVIESYEDGQVMVNETALQQLQDFRERLMAPPPAQPPLPPPDTGNEPLSPPPNAPPPNSPPSSEPGIAQIVPLLKEAADSGRLKEEMQSLGGAFAQAEYSSLQVMHEPSDDGSSNAGNTSAGEMIISPDSAAGEDTGGSGTGNKMLIVAVVGGVSAAIGVSLVTLSVIAGIKRRRHNALYTADATVWPNSEANVGTINADERRSNGNASDIFDDIGTDGGICDMEAENCDIEAEKPTVRGEDDGAVPPPLPGGAGAGEQYDDSSTRMEAESPQHRSVYPSTLPPVQAPQSRRPRQVPTWRP